ncbi:MAG TPA: Panacea domain-containing protein [Sedimentisphaerales bacterium]|nr:Panacea domain-containing protein [Sedimentisphaerales bacterium]
MLGQSKPISFPYESNKATQVILWLLHKHGGTLHRLKLVKLIFYADRKHLALYGRPIVGGSYVAMQHGPVSSELLNYINSATETANMPFINQSLHVLTKAPVDEEYFSESDIQVLQHIDKVYGVHDRFTLRDLTHKLQAWRKNYPNPEENTSYPLPYVDFFDDLRDKGMLEIIIEDQEARDFQYYSFLKSSEIY